MKVVTAKKLLRYAAVLSAVYISYRLYSILQIGSNRGLESGRPTKQHGQPAGDLDEALRLMMMTGDHQSDQGGPLLARQQEGVDSLISDKNTGVDFFDGLSEDTLDSDGKKDDDRLKFDIEQTLKERKGKQVKEKQPIKRVFEDMFEIPDQEEFEKKGKIETMREFKPHDTVDWALEEELKKRRKKYFAEVEQRAEQFDPNEYRDFHEKDDHLAFVTAGSDRTWAGVLQFVYSVQYHYPDSSIGVFDLGLSREHREQLETFCKVVVLPVYMKFWPKHMTNLKLTLWRPILWQIGLVHFGHIVYVEPDRFLMTKTMKQYIEHSRRWGMTVVGKKLQYSPYVVTNPEMYFFLQVDTRKLQRVEMFDISMVVLHNSQPVRHFLMRHLVACTLEEYCIAPPGSQLACDQRLYPGSKKYANCHRYDLSAINILMYKWADFNADQFLVRDIVTANYDGKDVSHKVKVCTSNERVEM